MVLDAGQVYSMGFSSPGNETSIFVAIKSSSNERETYPTKMSSRDMRSY